LLKKAICILGLLNHSRACFSIALFCAKQKLGWLPMLVIGQNRPLGMLAKFSIPKFSEWRLSGKQP
jgi:hypothetical protein